MLELQSNSMETDMFYGISSLPFGLLVRFELKFCSICVVICNSTAIGITNCAVKDAGSAREWLMLDLSIILLCKVQLRVIG